MGNSQTKQEKYDKACSQAATEAERKILKREFKFKSKARKYISELAAEINKKYPDKEKQEIYELILYKISYVTWDRLL